MTNAAVLTTCRLTPTPNPSVFKSGPGQLTIEVVPKVGKVAFVPPNCDVTDASGTSVQPAKTPTSIQFAVVAGQTYHLKLLFDMFPLSSRGALQEQCTSHTPMDEISSASNPQVYTILG